MKRSLDRREQIGFVLGMTAVIMVALLALYVPRGPRRAWLASQAALAAAKSDLQLQQMAKLDEGERLVRQKQIMERLEKRPGDFSLFTFVDGLLNTTGLRNRAQLEQFKPRNASPRQPMVQLRLEGVSFAELVDLVHQAYGGDNLVSVYKMDALKPASTGKGLDCDVTFMTLLAGGGGGGGASPSPAAEAAPASVPAAPAPGE